MLIRISRAFGVELFEFRALFGGRSRSPETSGKWPSSIRAGHVPRAHGRPVDDVLAAKRASFTGCLRASFEVELGAPALDVQPALRAAADVPAGEEADHLAERARGQNVC